MIWPRNPLGYRGDPRVSARSSRIALCASVASVIGVVTFAPQAGGDRNFVEEQTRVSLERRISALPNRLMRLPLGSECDAEPRCDRTTGCLSPEYPHDRDAEDIGMLQQTERTRRYVGELEDFHDCRQAVLQLQESEVRKLGEIQFRALNVSGADYSASKIMSWNGDIFWAPASKSANVITQAGDEVRSVLGPVPDIDCTDQAARSLGLEVEGRSVDLKPNTDKPGNPLEFEHRDIDGNFVKWTTSIPKCDKPSLAGGVTFCGMNSRLGRQARANVEWIVLCRKSRGLELAPDPYWQATNSSYALLGYIGFNRISGEVAFFDGSPDRSFSWDATIRPPGGSGYGDDSGRIEAEGIYDPLFQIRCEACHDNKEPRIVTPYIKQERVGYRDPVLAERFSLGELLPESTRSRRSPYRVIGSSFTARAAASLNTGRVIRDPRGNCTGCHTLTTLNTGRRFAVDAVGRLGNPEAAHRTDWALRSGDGKVHPWMVPGDGNILINDPPEITDADWMALSSCLSDTPGAECDPARLYNECPAPESVINDETRLADPAGPVNVLATVDSNRNADSVEFPKEMEISWKYQNTLGGVPERDDVRFNIAIDEIDLPENGGGPSDAQYPTIEQAKGIGLAHLQGGVYREGTLIVLKDASFSGHLKWTDPSPTTVPRDYKVSLPVRCGKRYLIRLVAKRFCFDQSDTKFGDVNHTVFADVVCSV